MKSDSIDYMLETHEVYPITLALFYDSQDVDDELARYLCNRLLDIYVLKKDKILKSGNLQHLYKNNASFESALPLILENVLIEFVKSAFIDFSAESMMVPWIYMCYNNEFANDNGSMAAAGGGGGPGA